MYEIERVKLEEIPVIKELLSYTWIDTYGDFLGKQVVETITQQWHDPTLLAAQAQDPSIYFATAKEIANNSPAKIIGLITARRNSATEIFLSRLYIHPYHQRQGVGTKLLQQLRVEFPDAQKIVLQVEDRNWKGKSFYEKHGFKPVSAKQEEVSGTLIDTTIMELDF